MDKDKYIITRKEKINKILNFFKSYTAQIALVTPIIGLVLNSIMNTYLYIMDYGFCNYYNIDKENIIITGTYNIYYCIIMGTMAIFYFCYSTLAVRRSIKAKKIAIIFLWWFIFPFIINVVISVLCFNKLDMYVLVSGLILLPIQWVMIFSIGYCFAWPIHRDILSQKSKKEKPKMNFRKRCKKKNFQKRWGDKDYQLFGLLLIIVALIFCGIFAYIMNYKEAEEKRIYGIVNIESNEYVLIRSSDNKIILQECKTEKEKLVIYTDTYLCLKKEGILVKYYGFTDVDRQNSN